MTDPRSAPGGGAGGLPTADAEQTLLARLYDGKDLTKKSDVAAYLVAVDPAGWPSAAMISVGELLVTTDARLRLALWSRSRTAANIRRTARATLLVVWSATSIRARLEIDPATVIDEHPQLPGVTLMQGMIAAVESDHAPYADLQCGVTFELHDPADALRRWRRTLGVLSTL